MNSGIANYVTRGKAFNTIGAHQKFDKTAYRLIRPRLQRGCFPTCNQILTFEGMGGPDGLKFKGSYKTDHEWDPVNKIGHLPLWISIHYTNLVAALKSGDIVKASFEAGYMAHYLTDSLTPAHHTSTKLMAAEHADDSKAKKAWLHFGRKGLMSSHLMFEGGVSTVVAFNKLRVAFDEELYTQIQNQGIRSVVEHESLRIAKLDLYHQFIQKGWSASLAKTVKTVVVKRIPQLIAAAWLAAYVEAGFEPLSVNTEDQK